MLRDSVARRAYAPTSNTAAHDNHEKISSWVSFSLYGYGAPLGAGPPELRYEYCYPNRDLNNRSDSFLTKSGNDLIGDYFGLGYNYPWEIVDFLCLSHGIVIRSVISYSFALTKILCTRGT